MISHKISLNMDQKLSYFPSFMATVNDNRTRKLIMDLKYDIPEYAKLHLVIEKPNGKHHIINIENKQPLVATLTNKILNSEGKYIAELKVVTEDSQITSSVFSFDVRGELKDELTEEDEITISNIYSEAIKLEKELEGLLGDVEDREELVEQFIELEQYVDVSISEIQKNVQKDIVNIQNDNEDFYSEILQQFEMFENKIKDALNDMKEEISKLLEGELLSIEEKLDIFDKLIEGLEQSDRDIMVKIEEITASIEAELEEVENDIKLLEQLSSDTNTKIDILYDEQQADIDGVFDEIRDLKKVTTLTARRVDKIE